MLNQIVHQNQSTSVGPSTRTTTSGAATTTKPELTTAVQKNIRTYSSEITDSKYHYSDGPDVIWEDISPKVRMIPSTASILKKKPFQINQSVFENYAIVPTFTSYNVTSKTDASLTKSKRHFSALNERMLVQSRYRVKESGVIIEFKMTLEADYQLPSAANVTNALVEDNEKHDYGWGEVITYERKTYYGTISDLAIYIDSIDEAKIWNDFSENVSGIKFRKSTAIMVILFQITKSINEIYHIRPTFPQHTVNQ